MMVIAPLQRLAFAALCSLAPCYVVAQPGNHVELRSQIGEEHVGGRSGEIGSRLITHPPEWSWNYAISRTRAAGQEILWLERYLRSSDEGEPVWRTVDFLVLPPLGPSQHLANGGCFVDEAHDPTIIAIVHANGDISSAVVTTAWRVDEVSEMFQSIKPHGINCDPRGWGGAAA